MVTFNNLFDGGFCLSTDDKPTEGVENGTVLLEMDTSKMFVYDKENAQWREVGA